MMKRKQFLKLTGALLLGQALTSCNLFNNNSKTTNDMSKNIFHIKLLRNATLLVNFGDTSFLVDPMLSEKNAMEPIPMAANTTRIPMTDIPLSNSDLLKTVIFSDAVIITHLHPDHWDEAAQKLIPKDKLIFCQPEDKETILKQGFSNVVAIEKSYTWNEITIHKTGGKHGKEDIGEMMGTVSGFVFKHPEETLYIAGDTIWCDEVKEAISEHEPDLTIVNSGAAQFLHGDPITMTAQDVISTANHTKGKVAAVHLEAINHCYLSRAELKKAVENVRLQNRILIPADGEWIY